jgi:hypothetical protein
MFHIYRCILDAAVNPRAALLGAREFRMSLTTSQPDEDSLAAYDSGRELAHIVTLRHYDECFYAVAPTLRDVLNLAVCWLRRGHRLDGQFCDRCGWFIP